jgi:hypothetical protein
MRGRVASVAAGLCCIVIVGCGSVSAASSPNVRRLGDRTATPGARTQRSCPRSVRRPGMVAFAARGHLELLNVATCRARVLAYVSATDVRFSPDGRWLAYSRLVDDGTARDPDRPDRARPARTRPPPDRLSGADGAQLRDRRALLARDAVRARGRQSPARLPAGRQDRRDRHRRAPLRPARLSREAHPPRLRRAALGAV